MSGVTLRLDEQRWREHLRTVADATPGLVPVAKGNGYGFGLARLAAEATLLGVDTVAVGLPSEVAAVRAGFGGDIVVLTPWDGSPDLVDDQRVIRTVSRLADLERLASQDRQPARVLVEVLTSMRRHGIDPGRLADAREFLGQVQLEGWTIHLPLLDEGRYAEVERLARAALETAPAPLWLSHLPVDDASRLARELAGRTGDPVPVRVRVGTRLWLDHPGSRTTTATVLDVHRVERGDRAGYRQRPCPADGWVVVVAGGTSHGVGLEAPSPVVSVRQRAVALATGSLEAAGWALSPYTIAGKKRWFLEPPHMQSSLLFVPRKVAVPAVGDEIGVELRLTTATVDRIVAR